MTLFNDGLPFLGCPVKGWPITAGSDFRGPMFLI